SMSVTRSLDGSLPPLADALAQSGQVARRRVNSIDLLRGLVMVLMALDHTRDFFAAGSMNPRDIAEPAVFLTRWVTHFCAPTFILLAGMSAHLYGARGRSTQECGRFLLTRGLLLILIELTLVPFGWRFNFDHTVFVFQVIWVIGASMVVLAGLVHLPRWIIAVVGLGIILGHNLLDGIRAEHVVAAGSPWTWVWNFLHQPGLLRGGSWAVYPLYSLLPWVGVRATGYAIGPIMQLEQARRRRLLLWLGTGVCVGFVLLRASNLYGDPVAWTIRQDWLATALSFIDCEKYPASLLYLMMTLGPALIVLAVIEGASGRLAGLVTTIGRLPPLSHVLPLYLIHGLAVLFAAMTVGDSTWLFGGAPLHKPANYGLPLPGIYAVWLFVVITLYPVCQRFAELKQHRSEWWWSYI